MVPLTRLNGGLLHLNADLVATIEEHHDTVVTLVDGTRLVVGETATQVVAAIVEFRAAVRAASERMLLAPVATPPRASGSSSGDALVLTLRPGIGE